MKKEIYQIAAFAIVGFIAFGLFAVIAQLGVGG